MMISLVELETAEVHRHDFCDMSFRANYLTLHPLGTRKTSHTVTYLKRTYIHCAS